jgi:hypothetical protein
MSVVNGYFIGRTNALSQPARGTSPPKRHSDKGTVRRACPAAEINASGGAALRRIAEQLRELFRHRAGGDKKSQRRDIERAKALAGVLED